MMKPAPCKVSILIGGCEFLCAFMCGLLPWVHSQKVTVGLPGRVTSCPVNAPTKQLRRMDRPFPPLLLLLLKGQVGCVWSLCHFLTTVNPAEWATLSFINKIDSVLRVADMLTFVLGSWTLKYALPFCAHPISNSRCVCTTHIPHRKGDLCVHAHYAQHVCLVVSPN